MVRLELCIERDTAFQAEEPPSRLEGSGHPFTRPEDIQNRLYFSTTPRRLPVLSTLLRPVLILTALTTLKASGPVPILALRGSLGAQLMSATPETRRSSNDSVLKTTTWGARVALLA